jgi:S1-C subfamily serine protease
MSINASALRAFSDEVTATVRHVSRAIVAIRGRGQRPTTGTIVGPDLVVAIDHVIGDGNGLTVLPHEGDGLAATLAGRDAGHDLALLRVPSLNGTPLAPAKEAARLGELVISVSRTWHGHPAASVGVVSAVGGPVVLGHGLRLEQVVRADVASTRGISGSPLVTATGELLGIVNAGLARGLPLAVPHDIVARVVDTLARHGRIPKGYLGAGLQPVALRDVATARTRKDAARKGEAGEDRTPDSVLRQGLLVVSIQPDGPADKAGLLVGDVVLAAAGQPVEHVAHLQPLLAGDRIGSVLELEVARGGKPVHVAVTIGDRAH